MSSLTLSGRQPYLQASSGVVIDGGWQEMMIWEEESQGLFGCLACGAFLCFPFGQRKGGSLSLPGAEIKSDVTGAVNSP